MGTAHAVAAPTTPLDKVVRKIDEISTLPQVALRVIEVANDPDAGAADLKDVMEGDAALSARVLRCVNSSAYAVRTKITNLQHAIAYLGLKQIRNLATTASVAELFKKEEGFAGYRRCDLWRHLVAVGIGARLIALRRKIANFEDAYLAGLLHDVGIILEDQHAHEPFRATIESLDDHTPLCKAEQTHLGFDHTQLGERVAEAWKFPEAVIAAIRYHHAPALYRGPSLSVVHCVEVANLICTLKGMTSVGRKLISVSQAALDRLSLTRQDILVLSDDLDEEVSRNSSLFQL